MKLVDKVREAHRHKLSDYTKFIEAETTRLFETAKSAIFVVATSRFTDRKSINLKNHVRLSEFEDVCIISVIDMLKDEGFTINSQNFPEDVIISWE